MKGCLFTVAAISEHDSAELERFERFVSLMNDGKTPTAAYAKVYGQVVFEAEPGAATCAVRCLSRTCPRRCELDQGHPPDRDHSHSSRPNEAGHTWPVSGDELSLADRGRRR